MIKEKMLSAINRQINAELYSAYLYLSMNAYLNSINLKGFADWMRVQALEEMAHADKFYKYIIERGGRVILEAIDSPPAGWDSALAVFEHVYEHEQKVTKLINTLMDIAIKEKDHATISFLRWFVDEQVEEESSADGILQKLKLIGDSGSGLFMIDSELGQRVFTPPAPAKE
ncbi:MAG: ferritin [Deltaproteobacteria bacterium]|nr:ferritin [Deltaproteobacteria bacterium]